MNLPIPTRLALRHGDHAVAVADPTARSTSFDASPESTSCLLGKIMKIERIHGALEADMQVSDVALGDGNDSDACERQALEQSGGIFLVPREPVERFGDHYVEAARQ